MQRPRIIPVLLLKNLGLVKSVKFKDYRYIGDPINAVKIFNDKKADEIVFLDITASKENRSISLDFVHKVGDEASMPFAVGGGISSIQEIKSILNNGAEKVILNSAAFKHQNFIRKASDYFGASTITVCIDVKKKKFGKEQTWVYSGTKPTGEDPLSFAQKIERLGAGELIVQSIERDGTYLGYDIELIKKISEAVTIPVVALGGAGSYSHLKEAVIDGKASAVAAGSMFVYHGPRKAVLINYPTKEDIETFFAE